MTANVLTVISSLWSELRTTIGEIVNEKLENLREDMESHVDIENQNVKLMALCEAKLLENYSRKDNVKILNLQEGSEKGQESYQQTTAVIKLLTKWG